VLPSVKFGDIAIPNCLAQTKDRMNVTWELLAHICCRFAAMTQQAISISSQYLA